MASQQVVNEESPRIGFFDLPREIRDLVYEYSILSMRDDRWAGHKKSANTFDWDMDWSATCHCQQYSLMVLRPRPPYFAHHAESCLVPDRFLLSISLVSKQFSAEIRPLFWRLNAFHIETTKSNPRNCEVLRGEFGGPLTERFSEFLEALGPEAKELRRLIVQTDLADPDGPYVDDDTYGYPTKREAEAVLEPFRAILHRSINIMAVVRSGDERQFTLGFFECKLSDDDKQGFVAKALQSSRDWEPEC